MLLVVVRNLACLDDSLLQGSKSGWPAQKRLGGRTMGCLARGITIGDPFSGMPARLVEHMSQWQMDPTTKLEKRRSVKFFQRVVG